MRDKPQIITLHSYFILTHLDNQKQFPSHWFLKHFLLLTASCIISAFAWENWFLTMRSIMETCKLEGRTLIFMFYIIYTYMHEWIGLTRDKEGPLNFCVLAVQSLALLQMEWKVCIAFNVKIWLDLLAVMCTFCSV